MDAYRISDNIYLVTIYSQLHYKYHIRLLDYQERTEEISGALLSITGTLRFLQRSDILFFYATAENGRRCTVSGFTASAGSGLAAVVVCVVPPEI